MFGRCAGKTTRLSKLHQNRLVSEVKRQKKFSSIGAVADFFLNIKTSIRQISGQGIETGHVSDKVLGVMKEIKRWLSETKSPYPSLEEDPHFYVFLMDNFETLQTAETEYQNIRKAFLGYKQNQKKPKGRKRGSPSAKAVIKYEAAIEEIKMLEKDIQILHRYKGNILENEKEFNKLIELQLKLDNAEAMKESFVQRFGTEFLTDKIDDFVFSHSSLFPEGGLKRFLQVLFYGEENLHEVIDKLSKDSNGGLISVLGDPGWGKTIQLRQFTHGFLNDQIQEKNIHRIPIYVKAKTLSKHIRNLASSHYGQTIDLPDGDVVNHGGKTTRHVGETNQILIRSMLETESDLDEEEIRNLFGIQRSVAKNMILIVDAYDEVPSQDARFELVNFISDEIENHGWPVIMTCRNSHEEELENVFKQMNNVLNPHYKYKIHFTNEELQFVMPTKLANAWGMNSDQISHTVALEFEAFKNVLTHPLFVGLFCMLKSEGAELSVLDIELNSEDRMSIHHVSFLKQVIKFGLRINIKDRKSISDEDEKVIRKAFLYIAAIHLTMGINNLDNILTIMEKLHGFTINNAQRKILAENLGVMFVNGEKEIEWTHKTLPEVAMGLLLIENKEYHDSMISTYGEVNLFGKNDQFWSECLFLTLIENDLIEIYNSSTKDVNIAYLPTEPYAGKIVEYFMHMNDSTVVKSLKLLGMYRQIFDEITIDTIVDERYWIVSDSTVFTHEEETQDEWPKSTLTRLAEWSIKPCKGSKFEQELSLRIGNSFFQKLDNMDKQNMFGEHTIRLPVILFGDVFDDKSDKGILAKFFQMRKRKNIIGIEKISWPKYLARQPKSLFDIHVYKDETPGSHLKGKRNYSIVELIQVYLESKLNDYPLFSSRESRIFAKTLSDTIKQNEIMVVSRDLTKDKLFKFALASLESNPDIELLDNFIRNINKTEQESYISFEHGPEVYSAISKFFISTVKRKESAPGKIDFTWLKSKYPFVCNTICSSVLSMTINMPYHPGKLMDLKILRELWGIPEDFDLEVSFVSSAFDKINSLDLSKTPESILRYILNRIG